MSSVLEGNVRVCPSWGGPGSGSNGPPSPARQPFRSADSDRRQGQRGRMTNRPHSSLNGLTPTEFAARPDQGHNRNRLSFDGGKLGSRSRGVDPALNYLFEKRARRGGLSSLKQRDKETTGVSRAAYSASWLTTLSAIFVKVASVFFSSCNVASRSPTASPRPSSLAQVFNVP
jgi:hypothetical protein